MRRLASLSACVLASLAFAAPATAEVGGTPANPTWLVSIWYTANGQGYMCSGAIVAPSVVLTAAHCADGAASSYQVINNQGGNPQWDVTNVVADPGYNPATNYVDDAAILRLGEPTTGITPMPLAAMLPPIGASAVSYGWGYTGWANGTWAGVVGEQGYVAPYTVDVCDFDPSVLASTDGCLNGGGTYSIGPGDSGGPVIINGAEYGINDRCAGPSYDSVFTSVASVQPWLGDAIAALPPPPKPHIPSEAPPRYKRTWKHLGRGWWKRARAAW